MAFGANPSILQLPEFFATGINYKCYPVLRRIANVKYLQYLYAIRDLRVGLQARQKQHSADVMASRVVVGGRLLAESELERSRGCKSPFFFS